MPLFWNQIVWDSISETAYNLKTHRPIYGGAFYVKVNIAGC